MKLFTDMSTAVEGVVELNESTGEKTYVIKGTVSSPGKKNRNGRVYPLHLWESNVERYQNEIKNNTINTLCELEHPARSTVNPWEAVAKTRLLEMRDGIVYGEMEILNNNAKETNQLKALIDAGVKIGVSTRGVGRLGKGAIVEEYQLITTDVVANPSDYGANLDGFTESLIVEDKEFSIEEDGKIVCTPAGCSLEKKALEEGKNAVLADKLLASLPDTKSQIAFERKYGSVYKMSEEELLKHLANMNEGTGSSDISQDPLEESEKKETLCSQRAKALTEAFKKFSAEPVEISEKAILAFDIIALHEKKPTFKEIQKKIDDLQKEMKKHKKGSDEWDVLDFELTGYEEYLAKTISKGRGPKNVNEASDNRYLVSGDGTISDNKLVPFLASQKLKKIKHTSKVKDIEFFISSDSGKNKLFATNKKLKAAGIYVLAWDMSVDDTDVINDILDGGIRYISLFKGRFDDYEVFKKQLKESETLDEAEYKNIKQVLNFLEMARKGQLDTAKTKNYAEAAYNYLSSAIKDQKIK